MNRTRLLSALAVSLLPSATCTPPSLASAGTCPAATVDVATAGELQAALGGAEPVDVIHLADGTYLGTFVTTASGSEESPILLCGTSNAILDGDGVRGGYGLHRRQCHQLRQRRHGSRRGLQRPDLRGGRARRRPCPRFAST